MNKHLFLENELSNFEQHSFTDETFVHHTHIVEQISLWIHIVYLFYSLSFPLSLSLCSCVCLVFSFFIISFCSFFDVDRFICQCCTWKKQNMSGKTHAHSFSHSLTRSSAERWITDLNLLRIESIVLNGISSLSHRWSTSEAKGFGRWKIECWSRLRLSKASHSGFSLNFDAFGWWEGKQRLDPRWML